MAIKSTGQITIIDIPDDAITVTCTVVPVVNCYPQYPPSISDGVGEITLSVDVTMDINMSM